MVHTHRAFHVRVVQLQDAEHGRDAQHLTMKPAYVTIQKHPQLTRSRNPPRNLADCMNGDVQAIYSLYRSCLREIRRLPTEYLRYAAE